MEGNEGGREGGRGKQSRQVTKARRTPLATGNGVGGGGDDGTAAKSAGTQTFPRSIDGISAKFMAPKSIKWNC